MYVLALGYPRYSQTSVFTRDSKMLPRLSHSLSVRVRPSHSAALSKRCNLGLRNFYCGALGL